MLLAIGGLLTWQWNLYSVQGNSITSLDNTSETIDLTVNRDNIQIKHKISGVPAGSYQIKGLNYKKFTCHEDNKACHFSKKQTNKLITNGGTLLFTYKIKKINQTAFVLNHWAVQLQGVNIKNTRVEITNNGKNTGVWAAGASLIGETNKENISYFVFEGKEGVFPLYFQKQPLKKVKQDGIIVYGDHTGKLLQVANKSEVQLPYTLIISDKVKPFSSPHLRIVSSKTQIKQLLIAQYGKKNFPIQKKGEEWLQFFLTSYVLNEKMDGKSLKLKTELEKELTHKQQATFLSLIKKEKGHPFSATFLDELLSKATGLDTNYFENNKIQNKKFIPLYFINHAKWVDKNGDGTNVESITIQSQRYFLLKDITTCLGFNYEIINHNQIYITNGSTSFRLYPGENTFLYNDKAYSIKDHLLMEFNHQFYINEKYLLKIFNVFVREQNGELQIISLN